MNTNLTNNLVLAFIGDSVYETKVREFLILSKINKVKELQKETKKYVTAKQQALILKRLTDIAFFDDLELEVIKRARNAKVNSCPKNTDILTYKYATGLEALIGFLYLNNKKQRIDEIMSKIFNMEDLCI